jgi:hypothetical protein
MNAARPAVVPGGEGPLRAWTRFWFTPADPLALHVVRLLTGLVLLAWLLPFAGQVDSLFGLQGLFDQQARSEAADAIRSGAASLRPSTWSLLYVSNSPAWATTVFWSSVGVVLLFTLGVCTRITAILAWVVVATFTDNPALDADGDALLRILTFYLMIGYVLSGQRAAGSSLFYRLLGRALEWPFALLNNREPSRPSLGANFALRLLQVHFAIVFVATGIHKLQFGLWWEGMALWYPLHPPMKTTVEDVNSIGQYAATYFFFLTLASYAVLAWEIGFPLFAWRHNLRLVLLGGGLLGCLGAMFIYRQPTFGPAVMAGCLGFVSSEEWRQWMATLLRWLGMSESAQRSGPLGQGIRAESRVSLMPAGQK